MTGISRASRMVAIIKVQRRLSLFFDQTPDVAIPLQSAPVRDIGAHGLSREKPHNQPERRCTDREAYLRICHHDNPQLAKNGPSAVSYTSTVLQ